MGNVGQVAISSVWLECFGRPYCRHWQDTQSQILRYPPGGRATRNVVWVSSKFYSPWDDSSAAKSAPTVGFENGVVLGQELTRRAAIWSLGTLCTFKIKQEMQHDTIHNTWQYEVNLLNSLLFNWKYKIRLITTHLWTPTVIKSSVWGVCFTNGTQGVHMSKH